QGYHLEIAVRDTDPAPLAALYRDFLAAHDRVYGYAAEAPVRIVNLRTVHRAPASPTESASSATAPGSPPGRPRATRPVAIDPALGFEPTPVYRRAELAAGQN